MINIQHANYRDFCADLAPNSIDFICIDPPYTDGNPQNDVLKGHHLQTAIDPVHVCQTAFSLLKEGCFFACFGQMPTIVAWYNAAIKAGLEFKIDIIWCKVMGSPMGGKLKRNHETIYIFYKPNKGGGGKIPIFYKTDGDYEQVTQQLTLVGLRKVESTFRDLNFYKAKYEGRNVKSTKKNRNVGKIDAYTDSKYQFLKGTESINFGHPTKHYSTTWADDITDLTTVFVARPHNKQPNDRKEKKIMHPTVKPIFIIERLIELCTPDEKDITIGDFFLGSGTTGIAAVKLGKHFVGCEIDETYYQMAKKRIGNEIVREGLKMF